MIRTLPQYVTSFENEKSVPIHKFATTCCALGILSVQNSHSLQEISAVIEATKEHSNSKNWSPIDRSGGEQNLMCIVSPGEDDLEANLKNLGFVCISSNMRRRKGYPPGKLKMYLLNL